MVNVTEEISEQVVVTIPIVPVPLTEYIYADAVLRIANFYVDLVEPISESPTVFTGIQRIPITEAISEEAKFTSKFFRLTEGLSATIRLYIYKRIINLTETIHDGSYIHPIYRKQFTEPISATAQLLVTPVSPLSLTETISTLLDISLSHWEFINLLETISTTIDLAVISGLTLLFSEEWSTGDPAGYDKLFGEDWGYVEPPSMSSIFTEAWSS